MPACNVGGNGKCGVSIFLFFDGYGELYQVLGKIGQSYFEHVEEQLKKIHQFDDQRGTDYGFLLLII